MDFFGIIQLAGLVVFAGFFIFKTISLRLKGIKAFRLGQDKKGIKQYVEVLFAIASVVWSIEITFHSAGRAANIFPWFMYVKLFDIVWLKAAGVVFLAAGITGVYITFRSFGDSWRIGVDDKNTGELVTKGLFSLSRNPFYTSVDIISLGYFFMNGDVFFLCSFVIMTGMFHFQILQEEKSLEARYAGEYMAYKMRVRRYF